MNSLSKTYPRYRAKIDSWLLRLTAIEEDHAMASVVHEFPGRDGATVQRQGMKAREIKFTCVFWDHQDPDGAISYDMHTAFLTHVKDSSKVHQLQHPVHGLIRGCVTSTHVRYDERQRAAFIDVSFTEETLDDQGGDLSPLITPQVEERYRAAITAQTATLSATIKAALGGAAANVLNKALVATQSFRSQLSDLTSAARDIVDAADAVVSQFEGALEEITNPVDSLIADIDFGTQLPGRVIGSITRTIERYALTLEKLNNSPVAFTQSLVNGLEGMKVALNRFDQGSVQLAVVSPLDGSTSTITRSANVWKDAFDVSVALYASLQMAKAYEADERNRDDLRRIENQKAFDVSGRFVGSTEIPIVMSVQELEQSVALIRQAIQMAILIDPTNRSLNSIALLLLEFVNKQKIQRDIMVTLDIDSSIPVHVLCLRQGLPYAYADRIVGMNQTVNNPSRVSGRMVAYARRS